MRLILASVRKPWLRLSMALWMGCWVGLSGCEAGATPPPPMDSGGSTDTGSIDAPRDTGPRPCSSDPECDDSINCTIDTCAIGGLCRNVPEDSLCMDGERCSTTSGCGTGCTGDADCQDGSFCNGREICVAGDCFMGETRDCDDGNSCTVDTCDTDINGCTYEVAAGCDAGLPRLDGGGPCEEFDPATDYDGSFLFLPVQSASCGAATFNVSNVSFSVSGGELRVVADRFTLTQSPVPTGPSFDVRHTQGSCGDYRLMGTFTCRDRFSATWTATFFGGCSACSSQNSSVVGIGM